MCRVSRQGRALLVVCILGVECVEVIGVDDKVLRRHINVGGDGLSSLVHYF